LSDYEPDILISANAAGQHRNVLFEERDRHIKERLYCVAKIETPGLVSGYFNAGFILINIPLWTAENISKKAIEMLKDPEVVQR
ncbi:hypothetical protein ONR49_26295, partial [Salmonella enterica subsp. enterica serovar Virginia]|nr:hypothetical protein [Salmonella enterica subsp. enterica serovar Virginia]